MSSRQAPRAIRRADPTLERKTSAEAFRPFGIPRALGVLIYSVFSALLLIPKLRRLRRRPLWTGLRLLGVAIAGGIFAVGGFWWRVAAAGLAVVLMLLPRAKDPDHERRLQKKHNADYLLNGGVAEGVPHFLLLKGRHLLLVPRDLDGEVSLAVAVDQLAEIRVDGELYVPIYVSEAKQPPVREREVDRHAKSVLRLTRRDGEPLRFVYTGAFAKHLAETAAHAVYSVREELRSDSSLRILTNQS